ncbi:hypothetical protein FJTKL_06928 [Diaporthe vaccinii]|uniref:Uncharacterized protein n=1 Tax=Diaporthe vaccinii TaxID=105482 RepID=A0ABR4EVV3_9PEZI
MNEPKTPPQGEPGYKALGREFFLSTGAGIVCFAVVLVAIYRLDLATRSSSSFFLMAYELLEPLAALMSSSARHSAMDLTLRNEASRAPVVSREMAWLTRRRGDTSTAWRRTVPAEPIRVESSRGPQLTMASTATWMGFWSVMRWICGRVRVSRSAMGCLSFSVYRQGGRCCFTCPVDAYGVYVW